MARKLVLASSSPSRLKLLQQINIIPDIICPADIDEAMLKKEKADHMATRLARLKCEKVAQEYPKELIISADSVSVVSGKILRKTYDADQARLNLQAISGKRHRLYTSLCVAILEKDIFIQRTVVSHLKFKKFSNMELDEYIASNEWQGCSGSYAVEGLAAKYLTWISGSFSNIMGLPLADLHQMLSGISLD